MERIEFVLGDRPTIVASVTGPADGIPVLLLHGGGQTRHSWGRAIRSLGERGFRGYAVDLRGHGESGWAPDGDYAIEAYSGDLRRVLREIGRPAVLVGASLGGRMSLFTAGEPPRENVLALVLVDITSRPTETGVQSIRGFLEQSMAGFADVEEVAAALARYMPHRPPPADLGRLKRNMRLGEDGRLYWHWDPNTRRGEAISFDRAEHDRRLERAAANVEVPTLVLRGGNSELITAEQAQEFVKLFRRGELAEIPGAHHMVSGDQNDPFVAKVTEFVLRHAGR